MLNVVLFGPPGAGKGTQADLLVQKYELKHLSTGDILRNEIKNKSELGLKAQSYMDAGNLVPDRVVIDMISKKIDNNMDVKGFIFDGFPRTTTQAEALDKLLDEKCIPIKIMLSLTVDDEELIKRLMKRGLESGRADDQNQKIIENRIKEYNKKTSPLKDYFKLQEKLEEIAGMGSIEEISKKIHSALDKI